MTVHLLACFQTLDQRPSPIHTHTHTHSHTSTYIHTPPLSPSTQQHTKTTGPGRGDRLHRLHLGLHHLLRPRERGRLQRRALGRGRYVHHVPVHGGQWHFGDERRGAGVYGGRCVIHTGGMCVCMRDWAGWALWVYVSVQEAGIARLCRLRK